MIIVNPAKLLKLGALSIPKEVMESLPSPSGSGRNG